MDRYCSVAYSTPYLKAPIRNDPEPSAMLLRSSNRRNAVAAKSCRPSQLTKRYVTVARGGERSNARGSRQRYLGLSPAARRAINLPGRKAGLIVRKLHVDPGQLGRHPCPSQRRLATKLLLFLGKRAAANLQRRPNRSWRHAIDANSFGSQLFGERLYKVHRRRFRLR